MQALVVEDDESVARGLVRILQRAGMVVTRARRVDDALRRCDVNPPDLALVDMGLPDGNGVDVVRHLRQYPGTAIIVISGKGLVNERVLGLRAGADDYLVKPFNAQELLARIDSVVRRSRQERRASQTPQTIEYGPIMLDPGDRRVEVDGQPRTLTRREFDLLALLLEHAGRVTSRDLAHDQVWQTVRPTSSRTLDTHIAVLRRKLGSQVTIETIRGVGYRLECEPRQ